MRAYKIILLGCILSFAACTNRSSTPVIIPSNQAGDVGYYGGSNDGLFDGSGSPTTINTNDIFDTTLTGDEDLFVEDDILTTTAPQCIIDSSVANNMQNLPSACYANYQPSQPQLLDMSYQSYGSMDYCFRMVVSYGQNACNNQYFGSTSGNFNLVAPDLRDTFLGAQMGLIRCYRQVLAQNMNTLNWSSGQMDSFDGNKFMMLLLMSKLFR